MPKYDYICKNNNCETKIFEILTTSFEKSIEKCPKCWQESKDRKSVYQFNFTI